MTHLKDVGDCSMKDARRFDTAPEGWEGTVLKMKEHGEIDNPFALAYWMKNQGYSSHDAYDSTVLDAAHEMALDDGYLDKYDGTPYESAGAKPAPEPNHYERETEN